MCGRFYVPEDEQNELLAMMIREASRRLQLLTGQSGVAVGEVFPDARVAAVALGKDGTPGYFPMQWGFHRPEGGGLIINARSETACRRPMFRESMENRRCLIPASHYFEWQAAEAPGAARRKFAIHPRREPLMYLAAIYRYEEGLRLPVFSILTRDAAPGIAFIHPRMPVIFTDGERWLDRSADPEALMRDCAREMDCRMAG